MKAVITDGKGQVKLTEIGEPSPGPYQCLCRIDACATCTGTDKKLVAGKMLWADTYPAILGHESVGTVIACGDRVRNIKSGDRFLRPAAAYPWTMLGPYASWMGGFAELGLVTDVQALKEDQPDAAVSSYCAYQQMIPHHVRIEPAEAAMLSMLKEIASSIRDLGITFGAKVVVLGAGAVGMSMCYFAKLLGARMVIAIARQDSALEACRNAGADFTVNNKTANMVEEVMAYTEHRGVDFVLDAAGDRNLLIEAGALLCQYGSLCSYAVVEGEPLTIDRIKGPEKWKYIQGGPDEVSAHQFLLDLVRIHAVPFKNFYSHVLPFDDFEEGFRLLQEKRATKIIFTM